MGPIGDVFEAVAADVADAEAGERADAAARVGAPVPAVRSRGPLVGLELVVTEDRRVTVPEDLAEAMVGELPVGDGAANGRIEEPGAERADGGEGDRLGEGGERGEEPPTMDDEVIDEAPRAGELDGVRLEA